ncbi:MAG: peptide deformylase [Lentisphaeria bacterium]|nr:peptide deformylase [Lentisphaeria bacterium]
MFFKQKPSPQPLDMCFLGDPVLKVECSKVDEITAETREFAERMIATMYEENGIGLAAPQVGFKLRMFVIDVPFDEEYDVPASAQEMNMYKQMPIVMINPELSEFSEECSIMAEGCLSIPGVTGEVTRPDKLKVTYTDLNNCRQEAFCGNLLARCIQHEMDHLNGELFIEKIPEDQYKDIESNLKSLIKKTKKSLKK